MPSAPSPPQADAGRRPLTPHAKRSPPHDPLAIIQTRYPESDGWRDCYTGPFPRRSASTEAIILDLGDRAPATTNPADIEEVTP
jgi:hypothetical protein